MAADRAQPCQRWRDGRQLWRRPAEGGFDPSRFIVQPIQEAAARQFVLTHHYAGTYPAGRLAYGLLTTDHRLLGGGDTRLDGRSLVGVAVLSIPMRQSVLTAVFPELDPYAESLELGRFVLIDAVPANGESWFLARTFGLASAAGVRGLVSFSDPMPRARIVTEPRDDGRSADRVETITPGHIGVIYQATNAISLGRSTARTLVYLPRHGTVLTARMLSKIRGQESGADGAERRLVQLGATPRRAGDTPAAWLRSALTDLDATSIRHPGNLRYAWPLGPPAQRRRVRIALPRTDYPKASTHLLSAPAAPNIEPASA